MRVLVLGSGVIGVTSAYYLARQGFEVTVVDRQPGPGLETSFANAGQVSPGYSTPWAAPGIPLKALKWLFQKHAPLAIRPDGSLFQLQWLMMMLRNCTADRYAVNKERMLRLAEYSRACLDDLRADTGIEYEGRQRGTLQVFRTEQQLHSVAKDVAVLEQAGIAFELLQAADLARVEPALAGVAGKLVGGLRLPGDQTGDCQLFTSRLAKLAEALGVRFAYGQSIESIRCAGGRITGVQVGGRMMQADHYVMALGSYSRELARSLGLSLPVYPLKGYSITVPASSSVPAISITDFKKKIVYAPLRAPGPNQAQPGTQHLRIAGMADIVGYDASIDPERLDQLILEARTAFPNAAASYDRTGMETWAGLRPATPRGTPLLGTTPIQGLFLNIGQGALGWTLSLGSGRVVTDAIAARPPAIPLDGMTLASPG